MSFWRIKDLSAVPKTLPLSQKANLSVLLCPLQLQTNKDIKLLNLGLEKAIFLAAILRQEVQYFCSPSVEFFNVLIETKKSIIIFVCPIK